MLLIAIVVLSSCSIALAAPDEQKLGRDVGYPLGAAARKSFVNDESMRVGSFTHCDEIVRLHEGEANTLKHADSVMPLPNPAAQNWTRCRQLAARCRSMKCARRTAHGCGLVRHYT